MRLHREGKIFIAISVIVFGIVLLVTVFTGHWLAATLSVALLIWCGFVLNFFRNPHRGFQEDPSVINCPADGKVVVIEKVFEPEYFKDERWQVSIFMSPLNVHLNRIPISGTVLHYTYHAGKYLVAWHPKSSVENERNTTVIENAKGQKLLVRQIAGAVARRIKCYVSQGDKVEQGDELGFIKFGSRVDVFLPLDVEILVSKDQMVKGNIDILARWNKN